MLVFVYLNEVNLTSRFEKIFIQQKYKKTLLISRREKKKTNLPSALNVTLTLE